MDNSQLSQWKTHPVSRILFDLLVEHREALKDCLLVSEFETGTIGRINQIKGQINTLDMLLDVDTFFSEKITRVEIDEDVEDVHSL